MFWDIAAGLAIAFPLLGALFVIVRSRRQKEKEDARKVTTYSQWQQDYMDAGNTIHRAPKLRPVRVNRVVQPVVTPAAPVSAAPVQQDNSLLYGVIGYELGRLAGESYHSHEHSTPAPDFSGGGGSYGGGGASESWGSSSSSSSSDSGYSSYDSGSSSSYDSGSSGSSGD